jgi:REP element-mobilizing transposase RayT
MEDRGGLPKRASLRLPSWDYSSPAWYFVTICTKHHKRILGDILDGVVQLSVFGRIAHQEWLRSAHVRTELALDAFVIMPNHIHGIVCIQSSVKVANKSSSSEKSRARATSRSPLRKPGLPSRSLGSLVAGFKVAATKRINSLRSSPGKSVWQRGYYDHVIRDDHDLVRIREYIESNPQKWEEDEYFPN